MSTRKIGRRARTKPGKVRRSQIVIAITAGLSLFAAWTILARSGAIDSAFGRNEPGRESKTHQEVSIESLNANSPSKEYVYAGSRLVATEEPGGGSQTGRPTPFDFDGDGRTDLAVWRPSDGFWYIINSSTGMGRSQGWGLPDDKLVPGDYDGDRNPDLAVWRPSNGTWYIINSSTGAGRVQGWGLNGDIPVPGD